MPQGLACAHNFLSKFAESSMKLERKEERQRPRPRGTARPSKQDSNTDEYDTPSNAASNASPDPHIHMHMLSEVSHYLSEVVLHIDARYEEAAAGLGSETQTGLPMPPHTHTAMVEKKRESHVKERESHVMREPQEQPLAVPATFSWKEIALILNAMAKIKTLLNSPSSPSSLSSLSRGTGERRRSSSSSGSGSRRAFGVGGGDEARTRVRGVDDLVLIALASRAARLEATAPGRPMLTYADVC